ncbi:MAG TPA: class D sortase [Vicinamibacterales bacterium]|jgi:sortase A|nr:class D sortase [Vicinamibacterales bacterium]
MESARGIDHATIDRRARQWRLAERVAWAVGVVCVVGWSVAYIDGVVGKRRELDRFAALQRSGLREPDQPDQTLWSPERIAAWRNVVNTPGAAPLAVLRIPRLRIEAPVLEGTDEIVLNRGLGHIDETAAPGADGNSGIAGHRDGFFRGLKDIVVGDVIELETLHGTDAYRVERTWIVNPEDVSVLDPTPTRSITLVTCYPFYFVGSAPQRFIVRAAMRQ